jgi:hypothetical protein
MQWAGQGWRAEVSLKDPTQRKKSIDDLKALMSVVKVEATNVLDAIQKGETFESSLRELTKLQQTGIRMAFLAWVGVEGGTLTLMHMQAAALASASQPEFLSVLTKSFPRGMNRVQQGYRLHLESLGDTSDEEAKAPSAFEALSARQSLQELQLFLQNTNITTNRTVFRSDHASNYLVLKGRLGRDKDLLLQQLREVLEAPESEDVNNLRPAWPWTLREHLSRGT